MFIEKWNAPIRIPLYGRKNTNANLPINIALL